MSLNFRTFPDLQQLQQAVADLLCEAVERPGEQPRVIMLSGGRTPLPVYKKLTQAPPKAAAPLHFMLSDERFVPRSDSQSNTGQIDPMCQSIGYPLPDLPMNFFWEHSALVFEDLLQNWIDEGAAFDTGLLGMGADGHTASLFSLEDIEAGKGHLAIGIEKPEPPHRISTTVGLLQRFERIVFLVAGADKLDRLKILRDNPESIPAGVVANACKHVEIWTDQEL